MIRTMPEGGMAYRRPFAQDPNPGSGNGGSVTPKDQHSHDSDMEKWATENLPRIIAEAQALAARIKDPEVKGEDRKAALAERRVALSRIAAMKSILGL